MTLVVEDDAAVRGRMAVTLLDLGLPDVEGVDIIRKVRGWTGMPAIVISARSEDADKAEALDVGADNYLTKPLDGYDWPFRRSAPAPARTRRSRCRG